MRYIDKLVEYADMNINIELIIAKVKLSLEKFKDLKKGDIIELNRDASNQVDLYLNDFKIADVEILIDENVKARIIEFRKID